MAAPDDRGKGGAGEVLGAFLKLGCTSFGGPIAHLGYFQNEFVVRRKWISLSHYADVVALCQFLPGPASSQVGLVIGWKRAGWRGALAAWLGFTLPSAALMVAFAYGVRSIGGLAHAGWVQGLKIAAAAVVAQAVVTMARKLCPDAARVSIAAAAAAVLVLFPTAWVQLVVLAGGAVAGLLARRWIASEQPAPVAMPLQRRNAGFVFLGLFFGLLFALPWLAGIWPYRSLLVLNGFYRAGALVFGGGHVVLPLLQQTTVKLGWVSQDVFLAGYGAAQAVPGPLFSFSAYLGTVVPPGGVGGAFLALIAIYLPGVFVLFGTLPQWERLRGVPWARLLLAGVNAAVVGLLAGAFYSPIWTSTITSPARFALALAGFCALQFWRWPPWTIVAACALAGALWFG